MSQLGGSALFLSKYTQLGRGEPMQTPQSDFFNGRHRHDQNLRARRCRDICGHSKVPVINGLTDDYHL